MPAHPYMHANSALWLLTLLAQRLFDPHMNADTPLLLWTYTERHKYTEPSETEMVFSNPINQQNRNFIWGISVS